MAIIHADDDDGRKVMAYAHKSAIHELTKLGA